jgi:hypothetical protein
MAPTLTEKAQRVVRFLIGMRHPVVHTAMEAYGFTKKDADEGMQLISALTVVRGGMTPVAIASTTRDLDAWENRWFPIAQAAMTRCYPAVAARFFLNLSQGSGLDVVATVQLFLTRYDELGDEAKYGPEGGKARDLLTTRGLTPNVISEARAMMEALTSPIEPGKGELSSQDAAKDEEKLWAWYLDWSRVARIAITNRGLLHMLGFLKSPRATGDEADAEGAAAAPTNGATTTAPAPAPAPAPATTGASN